VVLDGNTLYEEQKPKFWKGKYHGKRGPGFWKNCGPMNQQEVPQEHS